jgi:P-type Ca2+ transporter type 2C
MKQSGGLTSSEAEKLLGLHGYNELQTQTRITPLGMFLHQLNSPLIYILIAATIASFILGDTVEGILIMVIVVLNALLGFFQEYRAEKALLALKHMTVSKIQVIRDGTIIEIDNKLLVPGDTILLEEGNKIPADGTIVDSMHFEVNESSLTGESLPVEKSQHSKDIDRVYLGTIVSKGRATVVIDTTGMNTRFGKIAKELSEIEKEETPLEKKLQIVAKQLGVIALGAALLIVTIGLLQHNPIVEMFLTGISVAVAAVPEGLPAVITITLALGTARMARQKAILRKLAAIESVGGVTIIATDKTGTLTQNKMHVVRASVNGSQYTVHSKILLPKSLMLEKLMKTGILCNNASLAPVRDHGSFDVIGDQTEGSLLLLAHSQKVSIDAVKSGAKLLDEHAFDATTKTMSVIYKDSSGTFVYTKGAPESILERCSHYLTEKGKQVMTENEQKRITEGFQSYAKEGLRTIALAMKAVQWNKQSRTFIESGLTFIGFVGIADPAREEVPHAIHIARQAGIRTIMITGDNELTAYAIAKQIHLMEAGEEVITGKQFEAMTDNEVKNRIGRIRVFARTTPEHKLRIVRILQSMGHIVAVTGDGVNDALALKQANVGVAMGQTGTDVAKEAAEMILTDDNYATLVHAIEEGRVIYDNMKGSIKYLIGCNLGEIIAILGGALLGWPLILAPIHILYMNLATDGLQAIALAVNPKHHAIMSRKPRTESVLFTKYDIRWLTEVSILTGITTLVAFLMGWRGNNLDLGRTLAFAAIILAQQFIYLDIASVDRSIFSLRTLKNAWTLLPVGVIIVQLGLTYIPVFQILFKLQSPSPDILVKSMAISVGLVIISEFRKRIARPWFYGHLSS